MASRLTKLIELHPFPDYQTWWPMGSDFIRFMARAIYENWTALPGHAGDLAPVQAHAEAYIRTVYQRSVEMHFVRDFVTQPKERPWFSGKFDAISFAFYRHAFELLAKEASPEPLEIRRRTFTRRVGRVFFDQMSCFLALNPPSDLERSFQLDQLQDALQQIGAFLVEQGYLRDHFAFRFGVSARRGSGEIHQTPNDFLSNLHKGRAYALYEMGYPAILPSAVYLFHLMGEAQHHSSRTIEELFRRIGYRASETDDFDPTGFPAELVVELWEIQPD